MKIAITILTLCASLAYGQSNVPITFTQVDGINYANVSLSQVDGIWYAAYSQSTPATPVYTNSLHEINMTLWSNSVAEYLFDTNNLSWTNNNNLSDTSYIGTNALVNPGGSASPAWRASTNTATYGTNGWWEFAGDDRLDGNTLNTLNLSNMPFIISCVINPSRTNVAYQGVMVKSSAGDVAFRLGLRNNTISFDVYNKAGDLVRGKVTSATIQTNAIYNIVAVNSAVSNSISDITLYVNGTDANASTRANAYTGPIQSISSAFRVARDTEVGTAYFAGTIDNVIMSTGVVWMVDDVSNYWTVIKSRYGL